MKLFICVIKMGMEIEKGSWPSHIHEWNRGRFRMRLQWQIKRFRLVGCSMMAIVLLLLRFGGADKMHIKYEVKLSPSEWSLNVFAC